MSYENQQQPSTSAQPNAAAVEQQLLQRCLAKHKTISPQTACASNVTTVEIPALKPQVEIRWGDSEQDLMETDDLETLCLVASNPHCNVTIKNLTVVIATITDGEGNPAPPLPDGTPSVLVTPSEMIGFGDLPPHDPNSQVGSPHREAREIVLVSRGARGGPYKLKLQYSFSVEVALESHDAFALTLIPS